MRSIKTSNIGDQLEEAKIENTLVILHDGNMAHYNTLVALTNLYRLRWL